MDSQIHVACPQLRALLADFPLFREYMVQAFFELNAVRARGSHMLERGHWSKWCTGTRRGGTLGLSLNYQHEATTLLPNSDFLSLPDHVTQYGPVRAQLSGCTFQSPSDNGSSRAPLVFMIARTSTSQAIAR